MFGLTNAQGNHGEDVKELYYYLDGTADARLYENALQISAGALFPTRDLVAVNAARGLTEREYELIDTGIFDDDRYFDVEIEYAKAAPDDILLLITAHNRGAEPQRRCMSCRRSGRGISGPGAPFQPSRAWRRAAPDTILIHHPERAADAPDLRGRGRTVFLRQ